MNAILNLIISITGVNQTIQGLRQILDMVNSVIKAVEGKFHEGLDQVFATQRMQANLYGITKSFEVMRAQMREINALASEGIFSREQIYEAIRRLDFAGVSIKDNIGLVNELGIRMGNIADAGRLVERIAGSEGSMPRISLLLLKANITPSMLKEHGIAVRGQEVYSPKAEVLRAIKEIVEEQNIRAGLTSTLEVSFNRTKTEIDRALEALVKLFEPIIKITSWTATGFFRNLRGFLELLGIFTSGGIFGTDWEQLKDSFPMLSGFITWLVEFFKIIGKTLSFLFFPYAEYVDYMDKNPGKLDPDKKASKKSPRHDDIENTYKRLRADGWT